MTTDVEDPTTQAATAEAEPSQPGSTGAEEKPDAGATAATPSQETPTGTGESEAEAEFDFKAELQKALGGGPATPQEPEQRPGVSIDAVQADLKREQAYRHSQLRQGADNGIVQTLQREYGLDEEAAKQAWQNLIRPHFNAALSDHDVYQDALDGWIIDQLPEGQKKRFREQAYRNRQEWTAGLVDLGRHEVEEKYQADIKAGKLIPQTIAERLATDAFKRGRGEKGPVKGGNEVNGVASASGSPLSLEEALTLPIGDLQRRRQAAG